MKFTAVFLIFMVLSWSAQSKITDFNQKFSEMNMRPSLEVTVAKLLAGFDRFDYINVAESKAYAIARSGTGCGAGVFGAGDTIFLLIDIISEDPTDIMSYVFSVLYLYAWWQQNGKMVTYWCTEFWTLLH